MENTKKATQFQNGFWFSYYYQGYFFSVGYFAFTSKIEYWRSFARNINDDHFGVKCLS